MLKVLVNNSAPCHCAYDVRHHKFFATLRFNGETAVRYILVVSWSHSKHKEMVQFSLASPQTSFGVCSSRIHFSPTDVC